MIITPGFNFLRAKTAIIIRQNRLFLVETRINGAKILLDTAVYCGKNGYTENKTEGDGKTPVGVFAPGIAFGTHKRVGTKLDYIRINSNHYWVDDPASRCYNRLVDVSNILPDWRSAERMANFQKEYEYGVNINFNPQNVKGKGSAVFLHCKGDKNYTAGCIAADRKSVLYCIKKLTPSSRIIILP